VASVLTTKEIDDGDVAGPMLDQVAGLLSSFTADGAYDQEGVYAAVAGRHPDAAIIVPPRITAVPSGADPPTRRDNHLQSIAENGRAAWQKTSGYNRRSKVEAAIGRWKQVIGDGLRSRIDGRRATEVEIGVHVLNRMVGLGRPNYVRIT
jgi:Transposase DDE domain